MKILLVEDDLRFAAALAAAQATQRVEDTPPPEAPAEAAPKSTAKSTPRKTTRKTTTAKRSAPAKQAAQPRKRTAAAKKTTSTTRRTTSTASTDICGHGRQGESWIAYDISFSGGLPVATAEWLEPDRRAGKQAKRVDVLRARRRTPHRAPVQARGCSAAVMSGLELADHRPGDNELSDPHRRSHRFIGGP